MRLLSLHMNPYIFTYILPVTYFQMLKFVKLNVPVSGFFHKFFSLEAHHRLSLQPPTNISCSPLFLASCRMLFASAESLDIAQLAAAGNKQLIGN